MAWRTFMRAHWPALLAADFFTTEVWTHRGLLTYCTAFVIELHFRRVYVLGTTMHSDNAFVMQAFRSMAGDSDILRAGRFLICDRDPKWTGAVDELLRTVGVRGGSAPGIGAELQRARGAFRSVDQGRVPRSRRAAGRRALSARRTRVHRPLSHGTESSGHWERAD